MLSKSLFLCSVKDPHPYFQVRAKDAAGNIDPTPASYSWNVTIISKATAPDTGYPAGTANFSTATQTLSGVTIVTADGNRPANMYSPSGKISYQVTAPNNGNVTVRMNFSIALPAVFIVYKVDNAGDYTEIPETAGLDGFWVKIDANTLDITLKDNGGFDLNNTLGLIDDPIVIMATANIINDAQPIPTLSFWALLLLSALLSAFIVKNKE